MTLLIDSGTSAYSLAHGLSRGRTFRQLPGLIHSVPLRKRPDWLHAFGYLKANESLRSLFALRQAFISEYFHLDSSGYSVNTGAIAVCNLDPAGLARAAARSKPQVVYGPDYAPDSWDNFKERLKITRRRFDTFFAEEDARRTYQFLGVIHGDRTSRNGKLGTTYRSRWAGELLKTFPGKFDGFAVSLSNDLLADAFFSLQPWSLGFKRTHLFGVSRDFEFWIYVGRRARLDLSSDSTTFTIQASRHLIYWMFNQETGTLTSHPVNRPEFEAKCACNAPACACEICSFNEGHYKTTVIDLAIDNFLRADGAARTLSDWLPAHNVVQAQRFLEFFETLSTEDLRARIVSMSPEHEAACDLVDELVERGPSQLCSSISLLNETEPKGGPRSRKSL